MEAKTRNCLTREEKKLIIANHEEGKSYSAISGIVQSSNSIIYRVISRFKADKTLEPKPRTARSPMTTKREDRMIVKMSLKDRFYTATEKPISRKTVSRRLNKEKLLARIPYRKPLISKKIQKVCLDFATEHILWTEEQWNMVDFSDESKFNLFGSDGKRFIRRKNGECLSPQCVKKTVKFRGWRNGVGEWDPFFVFTVILMLVFRKNFFASMLFLIYAKGYLKLLYIYARQRATKLKLC